MQKWLTVVLFFIAFTLFSAPLGSAHKFYISLSQVEYNVENQSLEIALKVFTHDLERCVGKMFRENLHLAEANEHPQSDSLISLYIAEKLVFYCEDSPLAHNWVGKEVIVEDTWCYFEVPLSCPDAIELNVLNKLFIEVFDQQLNIMKFDVPGKEQQRLDLSAKQVSGTFELR